MPSPTINEQLTDHAIYCTRDFPPGRDCFVRVGGPALVPLQNASKHTIAIVIALLSLQCHCCHLTGLLCLRNTRGPVAA